MSTREPATNYECTREPATDYECTREEAATDYECTREEPATDYELSVHLGAEVAHPRKVGREEDAVAYAARAPAHHRPLAPSRG